MTENGTAHSEAGSKAGRGWGVSAYYRRYLEKLVGLLVPERDRILECGCGTGSLLASLHPKEGVGIDVSEGVVDKARGAHPGLRFDAAAPSFMAANMTETWRHFLYDGTQAHSVDDMQSDMRDVGKKRIATIRAYGVPNPF